MVNGKSKYKRFSYLTLIINLIEYIFCIKDRMRWKEKSKILIKFNFNEIHTTLTHDSNVASKRIRKERKE